MIQHALNAYKFSDFFTTHKGLSEFTDYMLGQILEI